VDGAGGVQAAKAANSNLGVLAVFDVVRPRSDMYLRAEPFSKERKNNVLNPGCELRDHAASLQASYSTSDNSELDFDDESLALGVVQMQEGV